MTLNGAALLSNIAYDTFDGPKSWTFANGQAIAIARDQNGRITSDAIESSFSYDPASNITAITLGGLSSITGSNSYGYDTRDEINALSGSTSSSGAAGTWAYDNGGNRSNSTTNSISTVYTIASSSNRISQIKPGAAATTVYSYDADGSVTADGTNTYTYNAAERLVTAKHGAVTVNYLQDGLGERVQKSNSTGTTNFIYGLQGQLIGEYGASGSLVEETVYLGRLPVAVVTPAGTYYVLTDHLGTPRQINNASSQAVWTWAPGPFGSLAANQNPSGLGIFTYNPRFPGQYYDSETGNFYNYQRDYNPTIGRYLESDPIGLAAGTANTYSYVNGNPLSFADPWGLYPAVSVTMQNGSTSVPMTTVKNAAQAASYGLPIGTPTAIAVPPGVDPQSEVNDWATRSFNGPVPFAYYWRPDGEHDYKLQNAMYDAYGNFEYGATGAAAGYSCGTLTGMGDLLHHGHNNPINSTDIQSGYNAISNGGMLTIIDYTPPAISTLH